MAEDKTAKQLEGANPKPTWLQEVEADAVRITLKRMRDAEEEKAYQAEKQAEK